MSTIVSLTVRPFGGSARRTSCPLGTATQFELTGTLLATGQPLSLADFTGLAAATSAVLGFSAGVDRNGSTADNGQLLAAAVPWMMMVGGFGLIRAALRRQRVVVAFA